MNHCIRSNLYRSLVFQYKSEIQNSKSTLLIYFNNPVAIGEHPQHLEEMNKLIENLTNGNDKLKTLYEFFPEKDLNK